MAAAVFGRPAVEEWLEGALLQESIDVAIAGVHNFRRWFSEHHVAFSTQIYRIARVMGCGTSSEPVTPAADPYRSSPGSDALDDAPDAATAERQVKSALDKAEGARKRDGSRELDLGRSKGRRGGPRAFTDAHATALAKLLREACGGDEAARAWVRGVDAASGKPYYYHAGTGESVWQPPAGWEHPIEALTLTGHGFGDAGAAAVAALVAEASSLPGLRITSLYLSENAIGSEGAAAIAEALANPASELEVLQLKGCRLGSDAIRALARKLPEAAALKNLALDRQSERIGTSAVEALAKAAGECPKLEVLSLAGNKGIGDDGVRAIARHLSTNGSGLAELYLSGTTVSDVGATALAEWISSGTCRLRTLSLSGCRVGDVGAQAIADALQAASKRGGSTLTGLDMQGNKFGADAKSLLLKRAPRTCTVVVEQQDGSYATNR